MEATLLYDQDCGFCARCVSVALRLGCDVRPSAWQAFDLTRIPMTPEVANSAAHLLLAGEVRSGHRAIAGTLRRSRYAAVRAAGRVVDARLLAPIAARGYAWVAAHRHQLPGGTAACALPRDDAR